MSELRRHYEAASAALARAEMRVAELEAALLPFAVAASRYDCGPNAVIHDNVQLWQNGMRIDFITVCDLRRARELQA